MNADAFRHLYEYHFAENRRLWEAAESLETMRKDKGLTIHTPSQEQLDAWQKFAEELWPEIRGTLVPADLFDEVQKLLAERRKK